jgi:hypothetical protein
VAALRGRAAQPLRPGFITKAILSGDIPLTTGELVTEASVTDIHDVYVYLTKQENITRPRDKRFRGMTYASFITMFRFARCLGLVEKVREEPLLFPPPGVTLLSIRTFDGTPAVVESKRVIWRLTENGKEDELSWTNLRKAWAEHWPVPQKIAEGVPPIPVVTPIIPEVAPIEEKPITAAPPVRLKRPKLSEAPSIAQFRKLLAYLKDIRDSDLSTSETSKELYDISGITGDWTISLEDTLENAKNAGQKSKVLKLEQWRKYITQATEGFLDDDIEAIIYSLEKLV